VVEAGQLLAAHGGHDPEAELADFDWDKLACLKMGLCGWSMGPGFVQGLSRVPWGECRMKNDEGRRSKQSHPNATSMRHQSHPKAC
jgi:hypothetical protein